VDFFKYSSLAALVLALLLAGGITFTLVRRIIRPLRGAAAIADRIADGELGAPIPPGGDDETGLLLRSMAVMQQNIRDMVEREQRLTEAHREAEAASEAKSTFLANMSHELRTPLNAIIGFSEIMASEMFGELGNPAYAQYARDIRQSGGHLLAIINSVLDLSK